MPRPRTEEPRKLITPRIDAEIADRLYKYAKQTRRTLNASVELLLERGLEVSREHLTD